MKTYKNNTNPTSVKDAIEIFTSLLAQKIDTSEVEGLSVPIKSDLTKELQTNRLFIAESINKLTMGYSSDPEDCVRILTKFVCELYFVEPTKSEFMKKNKKYSEVEFEEYKKQAHIKHSQLLFGVVYETIFNSYEESFVTKCTK